MFLQPAHAQSVPQGSYLNKLHRHTSGRPHTDACDASVAHDGHRRRAAQNLCL